MPRTHRPKKTTLDKKPLLILGGLVAAVAVIFILKGALPASGGSGELPEIQLQRSLDASQPTLAFFHSSCPTCVQMAGIVDQVYPEFAGTVTLIHIDVYDDRNKPLMDRVGLQYIPLLIFYDSAGRSQTSVGVITAAELREKFLFAAGRSSP